MTAAENAATWRDLADQLTPNQIAELESEERTGCPRGALRWQARHYAQAALGNVLLGDIEAPADAREVRGWETDYTEDGSWSRHFEGARREVAGFSVRIIGVQEQDGSASREVNISGGDEFLSAAETRELAAALLEVADQIGGRAAR